MINWRDGRAGLVGLSKRLIKGFFYPKFTVTTESTITPALGFGVSGLIDENGIGVVGLISAAGQGVKGEITANGQGVVGLMNAAGSGVEGEI